ncbi:hypothetical protein PN499_16485 [Kamptonema animale CS-326]|jgi:cobalamin biosynthesis protein CobD/CbiB|uniref:hypothetical protein n=1 Tax=Kamptonema animale TaxID=92934 RepID=UPI00232E83AC|nr:hypothetical protein [Kamptonema animale]MDB9512787.1 hypothetical protein [Kamptonema animale CS-326]
MNERELIRKLAKPLTWGSGIITGIMITICLILAASNSESVKLFSFLFSVLLFYSLIQGSVNSSLAREIVRLDEKIEELERRIP